MEDRDNVLRMGHISARRLTRRRFLGAAALGAGLATLGVDGPAAAASAPVASSAAPALVTMPLSIQPVAAARRQPKLGGTLTSWIFTENPPALDPHVNVSFRVQGFAGYFYSRLLYSKKGPGIAAHAYILEGDLAESWQASPDGMTWTFNIRPNAKWQNVPPLNGRAVTAQDIVWNFNRFREVSPQKTVFDMVDGIAATGERTVEFRLKFPFAPFEALIASPIFWIMPREVIEADGDGNKRVVGSGPFIFDRLDSGVAFYGKKNPDYYLAPQPYVDQMVGMLIPDDATRSAALRAGELDTAPLNASEIDAFKRDRPDFNYIEWTNLNIPFFYWHVDKPPFNDKRVRQAISMAYDRDNTIKVLNNGVGTWNNFIPAALSEWWLDPRGSDMGDGAKYFKYDPEAAKQLLADAGYPNGFKITLLSTPGYGQVWVQSVELTQQYLKAIGIDAEIKLQEYSAYIGSTFRGNFQDDALVWGLETPFTEPHDYLYNMYHPNGTRNHAGVNDPTLTGMIEEQAKTLDRASRKRQIYEIQRYLADQMYYPSGTVGYVYYATQGYVKDHYAPTDYGYGAEVAPKIWLDR